MYSAKRSLVACMAEMRNTRTYLALVGKLKGNKPLVNLGIAARMILKWILKIHNGRTWIGVVDIG
jgi:hypothetical protein